MNVGMAWLIATMSVLALAYLATALCNCGPVSVTCHTVVLFTILLVETICGIVDATLLSPCGDGMYLLLFSFLLSCLTAVAIGCRACNIYNSGYPTDILSHAMLAASLIFAASCGIAEAAVSHSCPT